MKILYITTVGGTMGFFNLFIRTLLDEGNTVDIAADIEDSDVPSCYREWGCKIYPLSCTRYPFDKENIKAIKQIRRIVTEGKYDIVHCHTPIAAMCTRVACRPLRKKGVKVFYTAHGFHFYKGAPLKNWLLYYPVEWICAHWTDVLITINKEDYVLAQKHMHTGRVEYIPGVGIDLKRFMLDRMTQNEKDRLRKSLGLDSDDRLLLSVGELNANKNHEVVIRALERIKNKKLHYAIAGAGELHDYLENLAKELGVDEQLSLLGFRADISDLYQAADLYIHPSLREGLSVALMEAVASKTPVICSDIRGNIDFVNEEALFDCRDVEGLAKKIKVYLTDDRSEEAEKNYQNLRKYDIEIVIPDIRKLYLSGGGGNTSP